MDKFEFDIICAKNVSIAEALKDLDEQKSIAFSQGWELYGTESICMDSQQKKYIICQILKREVKKSNK